MTIQTVIVERNVQEDVIGEVFFLEESPDLVKASITSVTPDVWRGVYSLEEYITMQTRPMSDFCPPAPKKGIWWLTVPDAVELAYGYEGDMWRGKRAVKHSHVTLAFDVTEEECPAEDTYDCGVIVKGLAYNDKCAVLVVEISEHLACNNKHPHITLATAEGVPPVYSNDMLAGKDGAYSFLPLEAELEGQLEFFEFK